MGQKPALRGRRCRCRLRQKRKIAKNTDRNPHEGWKERRVQADQRRERVGPTESDKVTPAGETRKGKAEKRQRSQFLDQMREDLGKC